jgi:hypothetical protein
MTGSTTKIRMHIQFVSKQADEESCRGDDENTAITRKLAKSCAPTTTFAQDQLMQARMLKTGTVDCDVKTSRYDSIDPVEPFLM